MEKGHKEEDLKGLELEIESAIDRLFVEKNESLSENTFTETQAIPTPQESENDLDMGFLSQPSAESPSEISIEKLEAQILALEWEITEGSVKEAEKEAQQLKGVFQDSREIVSLLNMMEKALNQMVKSDESIAPSLIRFLLDSKETLKFLVKTEGNENEAIYRKLAFEGIEAKFSLLEGLKGTKRPSSSPSSKDSKTRTVPPPDSPSLKDSKTKAAPPTEAWERIEEMLQRLNSEVEKIAGTLKKVEENLARLLQTPPEAGELVAESKPLPVHITVFRIDGRLFGVESEKIFKLFKVPDTFDEKVLHQERIRLRNLEVRLIDLKKIFALPKRDPRGEIKILLVKDDEEYKGLVIGQIIKKLSTPLEMGGESGEYTSGMIHWIYQKRPVAIPVLDVRKM